MKDFTLLIFDLIGIMVLVVSLGFIIANLIGNHRFSFLASLLFLIIGCAYIFRLRNMELYVTHLKSIKNIDLYYLISTALPFLASFITLIHNNAKRGIVDKFYHFGVTLDDINTLAYVTPRGHIIKVANKIDEIKNRLNVANDLVYIKSISVDDQIIKNKNFMKELSKAGINGVPTIFKFTYSNDLVVEIPIIRREVNKKKHLYGYALIDSNTAVDGDFKKNVIKEYRKNLFVYLDLLNEPLAYLDEEGNNFVASHAMIDLMGINDNTLSRDLILNLVHPDDIATVHNHRLSDNKLSRIYYRLNTAKGYLWFEESSINYFGNAFVLLRTVEATVANRVIFGNYKDMTKLVNSLCVDNRKFGIVMLNMNNIQTINANLGKDLTEVVVSKFFVKILNGPLKDQVKVFKLGSVEYGLVVENAEYMEILIRDLNNNTSYLVTQDIIVNKIRQRVDCSVAIVSSKEVPSNSSREIIKTALDTLKIATDPEYGKKYCVYYYQVPQKKEYDLSALGINLSNDILDEFREDIKKNK